MRDGRQLCLFENVETATQLDTLLWCNSFDRQESTLQSLSPYPSTLRSSLVQALIDLYSKPGDVVLDPFAGAGIVPFEAALADRCAWATTSDPYTYTIVRGKLEAPRSERLAMRQAATLLDEIEQCATRVNVEHESGWVQAFFHPQTLQELLVAFRLLQQSQNYFLMACLLGILQHVLPGYLSYPSNPQGAYLRRVTYSPEQFPHLYTYRDLRSRLLAKIKRSYRRHRLPRTWEQRQQQVWQTQSSSLAIADASVDTIVSSPPHSGAFESMRDHCLRLWFLGNENWRAIDATRIHDRTTYLAQMPGYLQAMARVLKPKGYCVLVVQDVERCGKTKGTAEQLADLAVTATQNQFTVETLYDRYPPNAQHARLHGKAISFDRILVLCKQSPCR